MHRSISPSRNRPSLRRPRQRRASFVLALLFACLAFTSRAEAAPARGESDSAEVSGHGGPGGSYSTSKPKFVLPDFVYGGNAISLLAPIQIGLTPKGYIPRGRIGLQYDRQLHRAHWFHIGVAALFDRGNWEDFRMDECGLTDPGTCQAGTTSGMDISAGYTHKLFIEKRPWIVPTFRAGLAGGFWYYPRLSGTREQTRELSWMLGLQAAVGLRFFLLRELAIGIDLELRPGFAIHREREQAAAETTNQASFILPLQILPLIIEWRF